MTNTADQGEQDHLEPDEEGIVDIDEKAESFPDAQPISYFGTDFDVHGLVRRLNEGDIVIPTFDPGVDTGTDLSGFQRRFVWSKYQMDRFIESLLLGYPVPGIFLVQQSDKRLLVLDGQQRLRTLQAYYRGRVNSDTVFKLESVSDVYKGFLYEELEPSYRRTLDNTFIHGTIVKYDPDLDGDDAVYQVFERLNTGGTNLYPHEIRVALYNGRLARFIRDLNSHAAWRTLYGNPSAHLKDQEIILRFVALGDPRVTYKRPLKKFLNKYLKDHKNMEGLDQVAVENGFKRTCDAVLDGIGRRAFRVTNQVNAALVDAVMVGVSRRLNSRPLADSKDLASAFDSLLRDEDFQAAIARATADEDRVARRLSKATQLFGNVP